MQRAEQPTTSSPDNPNSFGGEKAADRAADKAADKSADKDADKAADKAAENAADKAEQRSTGSQVVIISDSSNEVSVTGSISTITTSVVQAELVGETWLQRWANCFFRMFAHTNVVSQFIRSVFQTLQQGVCYFIRPSFRYKEVPLSEESQRRLEQVRRKWLVLDLDETLVHSCYIDPDSHEMVGCNYVPQSAVPDYDMHIPILQDKGPIHFHVFKRPHVDEFLDYVSKWYNLVIFTASMEAYASIVVDRLDNRRGIFRRRFYRQHCFQPPFLLSKNLLLVDTDLSNVILIDNSPFSYRNFPQNAIPINSYFYDPKDEALLNLLPFLDALRFANDVRSVLSRRVHD